MRVIIETGTDVGAVAVGDPSLLGRLRACGGKKYQAVREAAISNGSLWRCETGADGAYLFHLFVGEDPPRAIAEFLQNPQSVERFQVPSGRLLVAGEECFIGALDAAKYPQMGREVEIPVGDYVLTAYRVDAPDDHLDQQFAAAATPEEQRAWRIGSVAPFWCILGSLAALILAYYIYVRSVSAGLATLPLAGVAVAWIWSTRFKRQSMYVNAQRRFRALEREMPSIVVVLRPS